MGLKLYSYEAVLDAVLSALITVLKGLKLYIIDIG